LGEEDRCLGKEGNPGLLRRRRKVRTETITFDIVKMDYLYTPIFGRGVLSRFKIAIKQSYLCIKMPSPFGIITVHEDQDASRRIESKPISGYSLINEVSKKPPNEEANSESKVEPRAEGPTVKTSTRKIRALRL
jgi:hypothetical protein